MQNRTEQNIKNLFKQTFNEERITSEKLPASGSSRIYYRIKSRNNSAIATYNTDKKENIVFLHFSEVFKKNGINVPEIFAKDIENNIYLQEDLGDETLFEKIQKTRTENKFPENLIPVYKEAVEQLAELQINGSKGIDYSLCYPRLAFDKQSIMWDLNYFKYNFLKFTDIVFDEQLLENDFNTFSDYLLNTNTDFFLYRDFQSRNIMLHKNKIYFIDYQGGRKGALQYDLVSLLYDAKADIPENIRKILAEHYIIYADNLIKINKNEFYEYYYAYALIRIMQAMGAYGYRGLYEKKQHFIDSIPFGLNNLKEIMSEVKILSKLPELKRILSELPASEKLKNIMTKNKLTVTIKSFSYKRGIPYDQTGNGGGYVFDCRIINNPGRIEKYKKLCGKDKEVADFLEAEKDTEIFFTNIKEILKISVNNYISRNFKNLSVNFGCTGGQHRSVYFAEKTADFLRNNFDINVELIHTEGF